MSNEKNWNRPWSTKEIIDNSEKWSLAGDVALLNTIKQFANHLLTKTDELNDNINNLLNNLNEVELKLALSQNEFQSLKNTQFIESRVYDDDETLENDKGSQEINTNKEEDKQVDMSLNSEIQLLEKYYEMVEISISDSEDESERSFVLKPKNMYEERPLPPLIGSEEWYKSWYLEDMTSDVDSEKSEDGYSDSDSDDNLPKDLMYMSETSSELDISHHVNESGNTENYSTQVKDDRKSGSAISSEESDIGNSFPSKTPISNKNFAEQLAAKLGNVVSKEENVSTEVNSKPIQPAKADTFSAGLFSNEPPPLNDSEDRIGKGIFSGRDKLFDEDQDDDSLFWNNNQKDTKSSTKTENSITTVTNNAKTDVPKLAAISDFLPRSSQVSKGLFDSDNSDDDDGIFASKTTVAKNTFLKPHKPIVPLIDDEPPELDNQHKTNQHVKKEYKEENINKNEEVPKSKQKENNPEKKYSLFDNDFHDDDDDLFANVNTKQLTSKTVNLFDDGEDSVGREGNISKIETGNKKTKIVSLFDDDEGSEDEDDLFNVPKKSATIKSNQNKKIDLFNDLFEADVDHIPTVHETRPRNVSDDAETKNKNTTQKIQTNDLFETSHNKEKEYKRTEISAASKNNRLFEDEDTNKQEHNKIDIPAATKNDRLFENEDTNKEEHKKIDIFAANKNNRLFEDEDTNKEEYKKIDIPSTTKNNRLFEDENTNKEELMKIDISATTKNNRLFEDEDTNEKEHKKIDISAATKNNRLFEDEGTNKEEDNKVDISAPTKNNRLFEDEDKNKEHKKMNISVANKNNRLLVDDDTNEEEHRKIDISAATKNNRLFEDEDTNKEEHKKIDISDTTRNNRLFEDEDKNKEEILNIETDITGNKEARLDYKNKDINDDALFDNNKQTREISKKISLFDDDEDNDDDIFSSVTGKIDFNLFQDSGTATTFAIQKDITVNSDDIIKTAHIGKTDDYVKTRKIVEDGDTKNKVLQKHSELDNKPKPVSLFDDDLFPSNKKSFGDDNSDLFKTKNEKLPPKPTIPGKPHILPQSRSIEIPADISVSPAVQSQSVNLFDSSPPPDDEEWDNKSDTFSDPEEFLSYRVEGSSNITNKNRSNLFDNEPPSLNEDDSVGLIGDQNNISFDSVKSSSFHPGTSPTQSLMKEQQSQDSPSVHKNKLDSSILTQTTDIWNNTKTLSDVDISPNEKLKENRNTSSAQLNIVSESIDSVSQKIQNIKQRELSDNHTKDESERKGTTKISSITDLLKSQGQKENQAVENKVSPGKLKQNLNINVKALLPGYSQPKVKSLIKTQSLPLPTDNNQQEDAPHEVISDNKDSGSKDLIRSNSEQVHLFDEPDNVNILHSITKERVRIPIKRKPSTRRGRQEALRKSAMEDVKSTPDNILKASGDFQPSPTKIESSETNIFGQQPFQTIPEIKDNIEKPLNSSPLESKFPNIKSLPKELQKNELQEKSSTSKQKLNLFDSGSDSDGNDLFSSSSRRNKIVQENSSKSKEIISNDTHSKTVVKKSLFDDNSSDEELFSESISSSNKNNRTTENVEKKKIQPTIKRLANVETEDDPLSNLFK